jgi:hypothetical protein
MLSPYNANFMRKNPQNNNLNETINSKSIFNEFIDF